MSLQLTRSSRSRESVLPELPEATVGRPTALRVWATVGGLFVVLQVYIYGRWIISGHAVTTPTGETSVPRWMSIVGHTWEVAGGLALVALLYVFLVRPWRRAGQLTTDGMFCLAFLLMYWQDPLLNYTNNWYSYTSVLTNFGSWTSSVPGWLAPESHRMPEPVLWLVPAYIYVVFVAVVLTNKVMRWAKGRYPSLGPLGLFGIAFVLLAGLDLVLEPTFMRLGFWQYGGALRGWSINAGKYYQFPLYESVIWGAAWAGWACLRYFRDDKGRTYVERGVDTMKGTSRRRTMVRFLALVGACNLIYLCVYNIPIQFFALHSDPWPQDTVSRSYFTNGLCGPGTTYACSGPDIPIPRPGSQHVNPDGVLVGGHQ